MRQELKRRGLGRGNCRWTFPCLLVLVVLATGDLPRAQAASGQVFEPLSAAETTSRLTDWVAATAPEQQAAWEQAQGDWATGNDPLGVIVETVRFVNDDAREWIDRIRQEPTFAFAELLEETHPAIPDPWVQANLTLWLGTQLSQRHLYEEALEQLVSVDPLLVVDPASYFFHRAVCEHHLLQREAASESLTSLLEQCRPLASRYRTVGELMQADLASLEEKSLNEVARKMRDVERRLDLGRAGQKVQKLEQEIIESLDELIAKLEQQAGGGGGAGSGSGQGNESNSPAQESRVKGSTAPGEVDNKDLGRKDGWGDLPDKEQARAKQILSTQFPPHYQRAIEAFNRKNAQRQNSNP